MNRPTSMTVAVVVAFSGAIILALISFAFLLVGGMVATGGDSGDAVSSAITGMAVAGGFSLLILASGIAYLAIELRRLREWPRAAFVASVVAGVEAGLRSVRSWVNHIRTVGFPWRNMHADPSPAPRSKMDALFSRSKSVVARIDPPFESHPRIHS